MRQSVQAEITKLFYQSYQKSLRWFACSVGIQVPSTLRFGFLSIFQVDMSFSIASGTGSKAQALVDGSTCQGCKVEISTIIYDQHIISPQMVSLVYICLPKIVPVVCASKSGERPSLPWFRIFQVLLLWLL